LNMLKNLSHRFDFCDGAILETDVLCALRQY
jgi:hypothetical protein